MTQRPGGPDAGTGSVDDVFAAIQERSVAAAGEVIQRLVSVVDAGRSAAAEHGESGDRIEALATTFAGLWKESIVGLAAAMAGERPASGAGPTLHVGAPTASASMLVEVEIDTRRGQGEFWLHNGTADDVDGVEIHTTDLIGLGGARIDHASVRVVPSAIDLPAKSSRGVAVEVEAPDVAPGVYRGVIAADRLPDCWLTLAVMVPSASP